MAKGLNLPKVTLVGVLDADLSLYTGGYRAGETTFNLLTQVVGRAGRGETPGRAILQTLAPEHSILTMAAKQDYDSFYNLEINLRRVQNAPPFGDLVSVIFTGEDEEWIFRGACKFRDRAAGGGGLSGQPERLPAAGRLFGRKMHRAGACPLCGAQDQLPLPLPADPALPHDEKAPAAAGLHAPAVWHG